MAQHPHAAPPGGLVLRVEPARWGLPSVNPFCTKVEAWLRLANVPYQREEVPIGAGAPVAVLPDGRVIPDSRRIVATVAEARGIDLDAHLAPRERATGHAVQRMLEEHLYLFLLHERWLTEDGWDVLREACFADLPVLTRQITPALLRREVRREVGREPAELRGQLAVEDVDAVADLLGARPYLLGDRPSSVDAVAFAFVASWLWCPVPSVAKDRCEERAELVGYCERLRLELLPEYAPGQSEAAASPAARPVA